MEKKVVSSPKTYTFIYKGICIPNIIYKTYINLFRALQFYTHT